MLLVKAVTGPAKARVGQTVTYRVTTLSERQASQEETPNVHWLIKSEDGEALAHILGGGAVLEIVVPERWAHHTAIVMPYLRSLRGAISLCRRAPGPASRWRLPAARRFAPA